MNSFWRWTKCLALALTLSCSGSKTLPVADPIQARLPTTEELREHVVRSESRRFGVDEELMLRISRAENCIEYDWQNDVCKGADSTAVSNTGCCVGIMQVHRDWYFPREVFAADCGYGITAMRVNACYGIRIYLYYLDKCNGNERCAVHRYLGATPQQVASSPKLMRYMRDVLQDD